jgi:hypothetical protein
MPSWSGINIDAATGLGCEVERADLPAAVAPFGRAATTRAAFVSGAGFGAGAGFTACAVEDFAAGAFAGVAT